MRLEIAGPRFRGASFPHHSRSHRCADPKELTNVAGTLYFSAGDGSTGRELWKNDGTATGTIQVKDIRPGKASSKPRQLTRVGSKVFFTADDGTHGRELWVSDGTAGGTELVKDFVGPGSQLVAFTSFNGKLFFGAAPCGPSSCVTALWFSNGTEAGTKQVFSPGGTSIFVAELIRVGPLLLGRDPYSTLWATDGVCSAGPTCTSDAYEVIGTPHPADLEVMGGLTYFRGYLDGPSDGGLWVTDGTSGGTALVKEVGVPNNDPRQITAVGDKIFFTVDFGAELWVSDGTEGGTGSLLDGVAAPGAADLTAVARDLYFTVPGELWTSDGEVAGTVLVADIDAVGDTTPAELTEVNGTLYMAADDGVHGTELWRYVP